MAVINDNRNLAGSTYEPVVINANDYYAFGSQMIGRTFTESNALGYRYGFNGKENDNEVKGDGNQQDYGMRIYDPRIGRFLSVDPITAQYPELTPYQFASNTPIQAIDLDGLEAWNVTGTNGTVGFVNGPFKDQMAAQEYASQNQSLIEGFQLKTVNIVGGVKTRLGSNFNKYQNLVFNHEGGFVNDPADPGGATNKGIIISNFKIWANPDLKVAGNLENLKNLTNNQAAILYKKHYCDRIRGDEFKNGSIAFAIYDWSITSGGAVRQLEKLFSVMTDGITIDSKFNSSEVSVINKLDSKEVFNRIRESRLKYYNELIDNSVKKYKEQHPDAAEKDLMKHTLKRFKKGWENRVNGIKFEEN